MTGNELQKIVDYMNSNLTKHAENVYDEETGSYDIIPTAYFNEVLELLSQYPIEEPKECCKPNYEAMYTDAMTKVEAQKTEINGLKNEKRSLEYKLVCAKGAIAMIEVIYGRRWSPGTLELIR